MLKYCLCLVMCFISVHAHNRAISLGDRTVRVIGMGGKIQIFRGIDELDSVTLAYNDLSEMTESKKLVGEHYFNNFSVLHFSYSNNTNVTYPNSTLIVTNVNARHNFSVPGSNGSWPWAITYLDIFTSDGTVNFNGEDRTVRMGDTRVTFSIVGWPFCVPIENCTKPYLDFSVLVQGKNNPTNNGTNYDFGYGSSVTFSKEVRYDNETLPKNLTDNYPTTSNTSSGTVFLFRFDNFSSSVSYSALVVLGPDFIAETSGVFARIKVKPAFLEIAPRATYLTSPQYKIIMNLQRLQEADDSMDISDPSHIFNSFANQYFNISNASSEYNADTGLGGVRINATTKLSNNAVLSLSLFVFNASGTFSNNKVNTSVNAGNVNVTIDVSGWNFCLSCDDMNMAGTYLDIYIDVNGTLAAVNMTTNSDKQDMLFHGSGSIVLPKQVKVDGVFQNMPNGYPKLSKVGGRDIYVLRFPKFTNNTQYGLVIKLNATDPVIVSTPASTASTSSTTPASVASTSSQVPMAIILLTAIFIKNY